MSSSSDNAREDGPVDLGLVWTRLWSKRRLLAVTIVSFGLAFTIAAFVLTPFYRAAVVLAPASDERNSMSGALNSALGSLGGLASFAGLNLNSGDLETEEALAVLHSRQFTSAFISDFKLKPVLFARKWDAASHAWKGGPNKEPSDAATYRYFNDKIRTIVQDKKTGLITMQIDWLDRIAAAEWANELIRRLNAEMRGRAIDKAERSLVFLERELETTSTLEVRDAINRLIEAEIKQRMLANVTQEYSFRVVDRAITADRDDPVFPNKVLLILLGPLLGLLIGSLAVLMFTPVPARR